MKNIAIIGANDLLEEMILRLSETDHHVTLIDGSDQALIDFSSIVSETMVVKYTELQILKALHLEDKDLIWVNMNANSTYILSVLVYLKSLVIKPVFVMAFNEKQAKMANIFISDTPWKLIRIDQEIAESCTSLFEKFWGA